ADRGGNLWVGTNGAGLVRFKNRPVRTLTKADGLPNNIVMTVLAAADGKLWAGNNCGGLSWFDGGRFHTYDEKDGRTNSCFNALAEDSKHDLGGGTGGGRRPIPFSRWTFPGLHENRRSRKRCRDLHPDCS